MSAANQGIKHTSFHFAKGYHSQIGSLHPREILPRRQKSSVQCLKEANVIANNVEWIYDTRASGYLCANKELMQDFKDIANDECVYMRNSTTARVMGKGKILLKVMCLCVAYDFLRRNLVFGILFNKVRLKTVVWR